MRISSSFRNAAVYWLLLGFLLAVSVLLLFDNLGIPEIQQADEARHGINAYEMMQSGDYLIHTYRGETDYWNLKPTLSYYGIILGYSIFGFTAFGLRFYSALSMFLLLIILALWMKRRYGSIASLASVCFLLACGLIYGPHFARFGDADAQMVLFYTIGMLCMLESRNQHRWLYGSAFCFGLAFMSKSWHAALLPVTCLAFVFVTGQIRSFRLQHYLLLLFWGLLPILPWAIARFQYDGLSFFKAMLSTDVVSRATTVHEDHFGDWLYYVRYLLSDPSVVFAALLIAAALLWMVMRRKRPSAYHWGIALWFAVPLILYSMCVSKLAWYIFISIPALAVAVGMICQKLAQKCTWRNVLCLSLCFLLMFAGALVNLHHVSAVQCADRYDTLMMSFFNRERDSGRHAYIQYESENPYRTVDYRVWLQDEVLSAVLAGDVLCLDGGTAAFVADSEPAYLIAHEIGLEADLLEGYDIAYQWGPLTVYRNFTE